MRKLFTYLKKSFWILLIITALLLVQAVCDLSLPDYTARIVNIGIQQGGVERAAPDVIRQSEMEKVFLLVDEAEKDTILNHYAPLDRASLSATEYARYLEDYPLLASEPLYLLNGADQGAYDELGGIMGRPLTIVYIAQSGSGEVQSMMEKVTSSFPAGAIPEDATIFDVLSMLPAEQRAKMLGEIADKLSAMPESMVGQAAAGYLKGEYKAIGINVDRMQTRYILIAGVNMLLLTLASVLSSILVTLFSARIAAGLGMDLRGRVFGRVVGFSGGEFDRFSTASLITRSTNDIQQIQMLTVMLFRIVVYAPILGVGGVLKVLETNTTMSWIIGVAVGAILALVMVLFNVAMPKFKMLQKLIDKLNLVSREILTGLPVIRAFDNVAHEEQRFDRTNRDLTRTNLFVNRVMTVMMPTMMLIMNGVSLLIIWVGAKHIDGGTLQVGDMMAFIQYTMQIIMAFLMISMISIMLPRASVSARRIAEVLNTQGAIQDPERPKKFDPAKGAALEFRDVSFRYPGAEEDVLSHISFTAPPGQTTAIIGATGSGKSTLVNLIPRFYDATQGEILLSGIDIREVSQHDLREMLGFVPQKGVLFTGTIESNIKFGNMEASQEDMLRAAQIAQAAEFIEDKPDGYQSEIAQGGANVSGGQRQRLAIARAIAKNPKVYVFDDSFSALDYRTDALLRRALSERVREAAVLIVAQRISTILRADQIIVLDEGRIAGIGTHQQLMERCEVYSQIALSQLSREELANE